MPGRILIAEDEKISHETLVRLAQSLGYETLSAWSGEEIISLALSESFDVILLDMLFPDMDGVAVLQHLRGQDKTCEVPVICMSASSIENTRQRLGSLKVADVLTKPIKPDDLKVALGGVFQTAPVGTPTDSFVLCIDESAIHRNLFNRYVKDIGARPLFATTPAEATTILNATSPCAIFIEIKKDYRDALAFLNDLARGPKANVPVVGMMSSVDQSTLQTLSRHGIVDVILKPLTQVRLQDALKRAVTPCARIKHEPMSKTEAKTVMVVEDFTITARSTEALLKQAGYCVLMARTAEMALELLQTEVPDFILLDFNLPGMKGNSFIRHLLRQNIQTPFAVVTGTKEWEILNELKKLGALQVLSKPADPAALLAVIESELGAGDANKHPGSSETSPAVTTAEFKSAFLAEIVNLPPADNAGYREQVKRLGHNLAGSAGLVAQTELAETGRSMEASANSNTLEQLELAVREVRAQLDRLSDA